MSLTSLSVTDAPSGKRKLTVSFNARHFLEHRLNLLHLSETHFKISSCKIRRTEQRHFGVRNNNKKPKSSYLKTDSKSFYVLRV